MAHKNFRVFGISVFIIFTISLFTQCDGIDEFDRHQYGEFKSVVQVGLLKQIAKNIVPEDSGNTANCANDLLKWSEDFLHSETWAIKSEFFLLFNISPYFFRILS